MILWISRCTCGAFVRWRKRTAEDALSWLLQTEKKEGKRDVSGDKFWLRILPGPMMRRRVAMSTFVSLSSLSLPRYAAKHEKRKKISWRREYRRATFNELFFVGNSHLANEWMKVVIAGSGRAHAPFWLCRFTFWSKTNTRPRVVLKSQALIRLSGIVVEWKLWKMLEKLRKYLTNWWNFFVQFKLYWKVENFSNQSFIGKKWKYLKTWKICFWLYAMEPSEWWKCAGAPPHNNLHQCVYERIQLQTTTERTFFGKFSYVCFQSWLSIIFIQRFFFFKKSFSNGKVQQKEVIILVYNSLNLAAVLHRADELDSRNCNYKLHIFAESWIRVLP